MGFLEWYNNIALFSIYLVNRQDNNTYFLSFTIISMIVGFFTCLILMIKYDKKDGFGLSFMAAILSAMISFFVGLILSAIWSLVLCYFVPLLIISYAIFEYDKIISKVHDIKIKHNKKNKNIIKDVTNDIKAEELAKQAYENLKKDFPNIKYETVLENIKSKM